LHCLDQIKNNDSRKQEYRGHLFATHSGFSSRRRLRRNCLRPYLSNVADHPSPLPSFPQISIHCFPFHKRSHADHRLQPKSSDHQSQHLTAHSVARHHAARGTRNNDNQTTALMQSLPLCVPRAGCPKKGHRRLGFPASEIHCSPARRIAHGYYKKANKPAVSQMTIISVTLVVRIKSTLS
jgi:hypothetical protein